MSFTYVKTNNSQNGGQELMGHMHTTLLNSNTNVYKIHDTDKNIRGE